jgi:DNA-binding beta-propeller fold protein YncE
MVRYCVARLTLPKPPMPKVAPRRRWVSWSGAYPGTSRCRAITPTGALLRQGRRLLARESNRMKRMRKACLWLLLVAGATLWCIGPLRAETVVEAYRSSFGLPYSLSADQTDDSCWAATGSLITHLAEDGAVMSESHGFRNPLSVSADPTDGSCWVADTINSQVVHLGADGTEVWRGGSFLLPISVGVDSADGSCWVADFGSGEVVHLDAAGTELWRGSAFALPACVSVNAVDGSCWVADMGSNQVVHLGAAGGELWRGGAFSSPLWVSANPTDASCWVADYGNGEVVLLAEDGTELIRTSGEFSSGEGPECVSTDPRDGSCWVVGGWDRGHVAADGTILRWYTLDADEPWCISVDPTDGSYWTGYYVDAQIAHRMADDSLIWEGGYLNLPAGLSVNSADDTCWASDYEVTNGLLHLAEDGAEIWRLTGKSAYGVRATSVNPTDGSCWAGNYINYGVFHVGTDGSWLWSGAAGQFDDVQSVSVNPIDRSCWAADYRHHQVVHVAEDGGELWRSPADMFVRPVSVSVNPNDGSCWVADHEPFKVVHLAEDGTELWRSPAGMLMGAWSVSVNPTDGSCWVATAYLHVTYTYRVVHLAEDGAELWRSPDGMFAYPTSVSVNPSDGSCWVADMDHDQVAHLAADGMELWRGGGFYFPYAVSVNESDGSCWVADTGNAQIVHLVPLPADHFHVTVDPICDVLGAGVACPMLVEVSVEAHEEGCGLVDVDVRVEVGTDCGLLVDPAAVELVDGTWSGEVALLSPADEVCESCALVGEVSGLGAWPSPSVAVRGKGDLDGNCALEVFDLVRAVNLLLGTPVAPPCPEYQTWAADTDCESGHPCGNGVVEIFDLVRMVRYIIDGMWPCAAPTETKVAVPAGPPVSLSLRTRQESAQLAVLVEANRLADLAGVDVTVSWQAGNLRFLSAEAPAGWVAQAQPGHKSVRIVALDASGAGLSNTAGQLLTLRFEVKGRRNKPVAGVEIRDVLLSDAEGRPVSVAK